jgi:hypothetical protein
LGIWFKINILNWIEGIVLSGFETSDVRFIRKRGDLLVKAVKTAGGIIIE